jgi:hypothetical protein
METKATYADKTACDTWIELRDNISAVRGVVRRILVAGLGKMITPPHTTLADVLSRCLVNVNLAFMGSDMASRWKTGWGDPAQLPHTGKGMLFHRAQVTKWGVGTGPYSV